MFRPASRLIARSSAVRAFPRPATTRRWVSTAPPTQKSRTWRSAVMRWGAAAGVIYYYNTTDVFAEEPAYTTTQRVPEADEENEQLQTIDALAKERAKRKAAHAAAMEKAERAETQGTALGVEELEEEADQQGAFNPETGEINWDCPCLGGMADGPCGEEFKAAFSCFVYSTEEPKGMDCIDRFKDMQNCFRQYPEIYGSELEGDDEDDVTEDGQPAVAHETASELTPGSAPSSPPAPPKPDEVATQIQGQPLSPTAELESKKQHARAATEQAKMEHETLSGSDEVVPKPWHDASGSEDKS
ncbi:uncharacterized protein BDR25DRAFT_283460 [Lindgomyces ingoldianus]|uniref:Uncharacterized protein n=1 Tax=Lindgomyces ingoldianus TaxID=673940 RepID=A0ACB6R3H8_9PLEO|nr:uncharacterized protein BDR25DRAFT_283460 [Lindgomyces ingoldianus]KAF2472882.1 hypothetical protein BDR25DRAFT_283460 [Lindgomyces ingoldianus]